MSSVKPQVREVDLVSKLQGQGVRRTPRLQLDKALLQKLQRLERVFGLKPGHDFFAPTGPIKPEKIPLNDQLVSRHPLAKFIRSKKPISHKDLSAIIGNLEFDIHLYSSGTIPAGLNPASDYSQHTWTRDTAIIAHTLGVTNHTQECRKVLSNMAAFYARDEQRKRFISFHYDSDPAARYRFGNPNKDLPHIRARIDERGNMIESDQDWSHSQLDAIGMWLCVTFNMARSGVLDLKEVDQYISDHVNSDNRIDSIFSVALKFLNRIRYWEQHDHGPWEDRLEPSRATSIGMCLAAVREARWFFEENNWNTIQIFNPENGPTLKEELDNAVREGEKQICKRIPKSGTTAMETERYPSDSALTFLLYPFNPGLTGMQERAILKSIYANRMGEVGFSRRDEDEYLGMDYPSNLNSPSFCDLSAPGYKMAEWTLFDPLLAAYYFQRYLQSTGMDEGSFELGERHLKRSLAHITKSEDRFSISFDKRKVHTPKMRLPEAFWFDSKLKKWRANENTPLLMAEAASALMFERGIQATKLWEIVHSRRKSGKKIALKKKGGV